MVSNEFNFDSIESIDCWTSDTVIADSVSNFLYNKPNITGLFNSSFSKLSNTISPTT